MGNEIDTRYSVNHKTMNITGIELKANNKTAREVLRRLSDDNPNIIQNTDTEEGKYEFYTIRFYGKEFKRKDVKK